MHKNTLIVSAITLVIGLGLGLGVTKAMYHHKNEENSREMAKFMQNNSDYGMSTSMGTNMSSGMVHSMSNSMQDMSAVLKNKTGNEFDQAFISEMIVHHQGAIDMANLALVNAEHQEIKDLAKNIISAQTTEIEQMKQWQLDWFKK
jgi:uncharacterized protein (DUF305 family)